MRGSSFVDNHPDLPELLWDRIIPIGLHGDGGQFTKQDSIYVLTWNSLTQNFGPTMDTRIIFTVIRSAEMLPNTLDTLFEAMAWSLNVCLKGLTPICRLAEQTSDWWWSPACWRLPRRVLPDPRRLGVFLQGFSLSEMERSGVNVSLLSSNGQGWTLLLRKCSARRALARHHMDS